MTTGTLYGIGIGPGDPDLITVKGADILSQAHHVFVPKARPAADSLAHRIAGKHLSEEAEIHELVFPMLKDRSKLEEWWAGAAEEVAEVLNRGENACFITLGDPLLYSTYIYLMNQLQDVAPDTDIETIPGIMAMNAAASLTNFPLGKAREPLTVVPTADDLTDVRRTLQSQDGTVVLMKIGKRLQKIIALLDEMGLTQHAVFVSRAGLEDERIETDLNVLRDAEENAGYLSIMLVQSARDHGTPPA